VGVNTKLNRAVEPRLYPDVLPMFLDRARPDIERFRYLSRCQPARDLAQDREFPVA
jgi:hypothetical protein